MVLHKFETFREASEAIWCFNPGPEYFADIVHLYTMAKKLSSPRCPAGIWKFLTIQQANEHRHQTEIENALNRE